MTKRWSLNLWNDWAGLRDYEMGGIDLLRLHVSWESGVYVSVDAQLLGIGGALAFYPNGKSANNWPDDVPVESLGREHAP